MYLSFLSFVGLFIYIYLPFFWLPVWYLAPLLLLIRLKDYLSLAIVWLGLIFILPITSLTPWWLVSLLYLIWILGVYTAHQILDQNFLLQSLIASLWFGCLVFLVQRFQVSITELGTNILANFSWLIFFLYLYYLFESYAHSS